jgi:hypothetical protein
MIELLDRIHDRRFLKRNMNNVRGLIADPPGQGFWPVL